MRRWGSCRGRSGHTSMSHSPPPSTPPPLSSYLALLPPRSYCMSNLFSSIICHVLKNSNLTTTLYTPLRILAPLLIILRSSASPIIFFPRTRADALITLPALPILCIPSHRYGHAALLPSHRDHCSLRGVSHSCAQISVNVTHGDAVAVYVGHLFVPTATAYTFANDDSNPSKAREPCRNPPSTPNSTRTLPSILTLTLIRTLTLTLTLTLISPLTSALTLTLDHRAGPPAPWRVVDRRLLHHWRQHHHLLYLLLYALITSHSINSNG